METRQEFIDLETGLLVDYIGQGHQPTLNPIDDRYTFSHNDNFSVIWRVTPLELTGLNYTLSWPQTGGHGLLLGYASDGSAQVQLANYSERIIAANAIQVNVAHTYVVVYEASIRQLRLYLNSVLVGAATQTSDFLLGTKELVLGHANSEYYVDGKYGAKALHHGVAICNGLLDRWNGVPDTIDINTICKEGNYIPPRRHLFVIGHWTCQEKYGNRLYDCVEQYNYAKHEIASHKAYRFNPQTRWSHPVNPGIDTCDFTFEFLFCQKSRPTPGYNTVVGRGEDGYGAGWNIWFAVSETGLPNFAVVRNIAGYGWNQYTLNAYNTPLALNKIYHIAGTLNYSTGEMQLIINGRVQNSMILPANETLRPSTLGVHINKGYFSNGIFEVANLRVWNTVRSPGEIAADMTAILPDNTPGLVFQVPLNEGSGVAILETISGASADITGADANNSENWVRPMSGIYGKLTNYHGQLLGFAESYLPGSRKNIFTKKYKRDDGVHTYTETNAIGADTGTLYIPHSSVFDITNNDIIEGEAELSLRPRAGTAYNLYAIFSSADGVIWNGISKLWYFAYVIGDGHYSLYFGMRDAAGYDIRFNSVALPFFDREKKNKVGFKKTAHNAIQFFYNDVEIGVNTTEIYGTYSGTQPLATGRELRLASFYNGESSGNLDQLLLNANWYSAKLKLNGLTVLDTDFEFKTNNSFKDNSSINNDIIAQGYLNRPVTAVAYYFDALGFPALHQGWKGSPYLMGQKSGNFINGANQINGTYSIQLSFYWDGLPIVRDLQDVLWFFDDTWQYPAARFSISNNSDEFGLYIMEWTFTGKMHKGYNAITLSIDNETGIGFFGINQQFSRMKKTDYQGYMPFRNALWNRFEIGSIHPAYYNSNIFLTASLHNIALTEREHLAFASNSRAGNISKRGMTWAVSASDIDISSKTFLDLSGNGNNIPIVESWQGYQHFDENLIDLSTLQ